MDSDALTVARELVARPEFPRPIRDDQPHPGWRDGVYRDDDGTLWRLTPQVVPGGTWLPDLNDPATAGVLLGMLWEADPGAMVRRDPHRPPGAPAFTVALTVGGGDRADGPTPGVAAGRALLALWRARG